VIQKGDHDDGSYMAAFVPQVVSNMPSGASDTLRFAGMPLSSGDPGGRHGSCSPGTWIDANSKNERVVFDRLGEKVNPDFPD
jgi:hypothetical protein